MTKISNALTIYGAVSAGARNVCPLGVFIIAKFSISTKKGTSMAITSLTTDQNLK